LETAISAELKARKLQVTRNSLTKVVQLWETKLSRHSVMTVGGTMSGKTVAWRVLQASMGRLHAEGDHNFQPVKVGNCWCGEI
jgi:dynein heavy chain